LNQRLIDIGLIVAGILEDLEIPYAIGGSVASGLHGEPRTSIDVDFAVHLDAAQLEPLATELEREFYVDRQSMREAIEAHRLFNVIHLSSLGKIDFHVCPRSGVFAEELRRARRVRIRREPEGFARIATPEDTILQKLRWYRAGDEVSDRQWRDVLGMVKVVGANLDRDYLDRWARELGVEDLLARALDQGGLGPS